MTDKDFETIAAIALEAPKRIGIMVASTPTGRRGMFYKLCTEMRFKNHPFAKEEKTDKEEKNRDLGPEVSIVYDRDNGVYNIVDYKRATAKGWAEFYYPTMVNPEWNMDMEEELRAQYSAIGYEHEILAEFGTEMVGVFNKDFIDEASDTEYEYLLAPKHNGPITIGIDWDKFGAATQIVVTQWEHTDERRLSDNLAPGMGRFKVILREEIPKGERTYDKAVKRVIELDRQYNPVAIYPDRGAGEYQIEMLREHLGDKVKGIHLGSVHEVRDPHSRVFEKKPIKPFMVNQTTLLLERGMLRIPNRKRDETIARQMTNYQVVRISPKTGEPTYSDEDEHALDAMMLSLLAFIIEMPDLARTMYEIDIVRSFTTMEVKFNDPLAAIYKQGPSTRMQDHTRHVNAWDEINAPPARKVNVGYGQRRGNTSETWGARGSSRNSMPKRRGW